DQVVASLEGVGAGLDRGLSGRLAALRGEEGWGRGAVEDRATAGGQVVDDCFRLRVGLLLFVGIDLFGAKRCQRAGGADPDRPVGLAVRFGRVQGAAQYLDRSDRLGRFASGQAGAASEGVAARSQSWAATGT